ncbi:hypothetical protein DUNSADRAFT_6900 [Dunaliella salina]|uniref:Uncharacterized protein n=1 Tax=Dunaliella salina TaxID=3046 RepID=A0ABQ7GMD3_DUNSA|nr:hypothetical protein DUNSADRAFT_6900 [Dunaliella salina]|eukprot:KAF5835760.1 hypothetical protein DUNSADRAFT_6900 [Dunaliella salina]
MDSQQAHWRYIKQRQQRSAQVAHRALSVKRCTRGARGSGSEEAHEAKSAFLGVGYLAGDVLESWSVRLGLEQQEVAELVAEQPALLEMSPNTVKARLESLAALLGVPLQIATALVRRHPALACAPPNATISRFKNASMALGISMQTAGTLLAKAPALLCCTAGMPGELNKDLQPHVDDVSQVVAAYEFFTMDWLQRSIKEAAPQRMTSFSQIDGR